MLWSIADVVNRDVVNKEHFFSSWHGPLLALAFVGFVIAVFGHMSQTKTLIVSGILMIFVAVLLFPIFLYVRGTP